MGEDNASPTACVDGNVVPDYERTRVTWKPDPRRPWPTPKMLDRLACATPEDKTYAAMPHGPGYAFTPDGKGGGTLKKWSKVTLRFVVFGTVKPYGA